MGFMSGSTGDDYHPPDYPTSPVKRRVQDEDESTLYREDESDISSYDGDSDYDRPVVINVPPPPLRTWNDHFLGDFQVSMADSDKPVYECWKLCLLPARKNVVSGTKILGIDVQQYDNLEERVTCTAQEMGQSELADRYENAVASHQAKSRRSWATRAMRGKPLPYQQDLENRCNNLPYGIRNWINILLYRRGLATSTQCRARTWTVVFMEERLQHRFTQTQGAKVKRHKLRFWKNPRYPQELTEWFVIFRSVETGTAETKTGYTRPSMTSNPWRDVDTKERNERNRVVPEVRPRRRPERTWTRNRSASRPRRDRSRPRMFDADRPPFSARRPPRRNRSFDSLSSAESFWDQESDDDFYDSEVEFRSRPRVYNGPIPVPSRRMPRAPTPPQSFPPPPAVAEFHRTNTWSRPPPPPPPAPPARWSDSFVPDDPFMGPRAPNPFHSTAPCPPYGWVGQTVPPPPPPPMEFACVLPRDLPPHPPPPHPPLGRLRSLCVACQADPKCNHFARLECFRPLIWSAEGGNPRHPDCWMCSSLSRGPVQTVDVLPDESVAGDVNPFAPSPFIPHGWRRPVVECHSVNDEDDTATILDEDGGDVVADGVGGVSGGQKPPPEVEEGDEDTQVEEVGELPTTETKEA